MPELLFDMAEGQAHVFLGAHLMAEIWDALRQGGLGKLGAECSPAGCGRA
jgi:hypothetical protein